MQLSDYTDDELEEIKTTDVETLLNNIRFADYTKTEIEEIKKEISSVFGNL